MSVRVKIGAVKCLSKGEKCCKVLIHLTGAIVGNTRALLQWKVVNAIVEENLGNSLNIVLLCFIKSLDDLSPFWTDATMEFIIA